MERLRLIREVRSGAVAVWAALESLPNKPGQLVLVERVLRGAGHSDEEIADWLRDMRSLATLDHPNVVRVREVVSRPEEALVITDFIDGVTWAELTSSAQSPSFEIAVRVFVDILSGLGAIHNLRDAKRQPLRLMHGELTPECVLVGIDGVARVADVCRLRAGAASQEGLAGAYLAPEVLLADDAADARADVYSVGAMLWQALSGRPIFVNTTASAIVTQVLSGRTPRATAPATSPWAAPLVETAARALSAEPGKRFASAAALAAELRRIAGPKLAPAVRVAALVRAMHGDRIRQRREALERAEPQTGTLSSKEAPVVRDIVDVPIQVAIDSEDRGWTVPPAEPPPARMVPRTDARSRESTDGVAVSDDSETVPTMRPAPGQTASPQASDPANGRPPAAERPPVKPPPLPASVAGPPPLPLPAAAGSAPLPASRPEPPPLPPSPAGPPPLPTSVAGPPPLPASLAGPPPLPASAIDSAPPAAPLVVPAPPPLPKDLGGGVAINETQLGLAAPSVSKRPAVQAALIPSSRVQEALSASPRPAQPKQQTAKFILWPVAVAAAGLSWWLASSALHWIRAQASSPQAAGSTAEPSHEAPMVLSPTEPTRASAAASLASAKAPFSDAIPPEESVRTRPATPPVNTPPPPQVAASVMAPPAPHPADRIVKRKYDPQGI